MNKQELLRNLYAIKNTLNNISVVGESNLDSLLGCIITVKKLISDCEKDDPNVGTTDSHE